jgi:hypothetical protein
MPDLFRSIPSALTEVKLSVQQIHDTEKSCIYSARIDWRHSHQPAVLANPKSPALEL